MAKISYDVSDAEPFSGGGPQPKQGLYDAEIMQAEHRTEKRDGSPANDIEVALKVEDPDTDVEYSWVFTYIGLNDSSAGRLREFTNALSLKPKGQIDTDKLLHRKLKIKINPDTYDGEYRARVGRLMKIDEEDEGPDEPEAKTAVSDFEPSREGEEFGSYDDWTDEDLSGEVEDRDLTVAGGRGKKRDKLIAALREDDAGGEEAEEAEEDTINYEEWSPKELMQEVKDRQLTEHLPAGRKGKTVLINLLRKDDEEPF